MGHPRSGFDITGDGVLAPARSILSSYADTVNATSIQAAHSACSCLTLHAQQSWMGLLCASKHTKECGKRIAPALKQTQHKLAGQPQLLKRLTRQLELTLVKPPLTMFIELKSESC